MAARIMSWLGANNNNRPIGGLDMVEEMSYLYIRIVKARDLYGGESHPEYDPCVVVKMGDFELRTPPVEKQPDPKWDRIYAIPRGSVQASIIEVFVISSSSEGNGVKGKVSIVLDNIPMRVLPDSPLAPQWHILEPVDGGQPRGELMMVLWVGTQADESFREAWHPDAGDRGTTYMCPSLCYLRVNVMHVRISDRSKTSEVFVRAKTTKVGICRTRMSVFKGGIAMWNEDLIFVVVYGNSDMVILTVEEKVGNTVEILGTCTVPLSVELKRIDDRPVEPRWYPLYVQGADNVSVPTGASIQMRVSLDVGYHVLEEAARDTGDVRPADKQKWKPLLGKLDLGILGATSMRMRPETGRSGSYYCVAKYGRKWARTRTIMNTFEPKWNEQYTWEVFDPSTVLTIVVFDNYQLQPTSASEQQQDEKMGKIKIRLSILETDKLYTCSYPLVEPQGFKKMGDLRLTVRFSCTSLVNLLHVYTLPILPIMHYIHPLNVALIEELKSQAIQQICINLGAAEPILRREVIEFLLDSGSKNFSNRKVLVTRLRLIGFLRSMENLGKWIIESCTWKNPWLTILVHLVLIFLVYFPEVIIPSICTNLVAFGIWNYRSRPTIPPHIDSRLSCIEQIAPQDMEEEFDGIPTACNNIDALRYRYDRVRYVAARVLTIAGDLAGHLERLQSLLRWRDRRATGLFMVFCVFAAVFFFLIPLDVMFLGLIFYILRPPQFRGRLPYRALNFFNRLPSRSDALL